MAGTSTKTIPITIRLKVATVAKLESRIRKRNKYKAYRTLRQVLAERLEYDINRSHIRRKAVA
jgi:hypothetical protein